MCLPGAATTFWDALGRGWCCLHRQGKHLFAQGNRAPASCFVNRVAAGKSQPRPPVPLSIRRDKAAQGAHGAWPRPHVSISHLSMIYCCCEELFVLRGFPAAPAKVSAAFGRGRDGCQRGEGMGVQGREKQSPLRPQQHHGLILSIPAPCRLKEPGAAGDRIVETWNGLGWKGP